MAGLRRRRPGCWSWRSRNAGQCSPPTGGGSPRPTCRYRTEAVAPTQSDGLILFALPSHTLCFACKVLARALLAQPHIFRATADRLTQVRLCSSIKRPHKRKSIIPKKNPNLVLICRFCRLNTLDIGRRWWTRPFWPRSRALSSPLSCRHSPALLWSLP